METTFFGYKADNTFDRVSSSVHENNGTDRKKYKHGIHGLHRSASSGTITVVESV